MPKTEIETFYPRSQAVWRAWLQENHALKQSIWVLFYKKKAKKPTLSWSAAVDEALCFGWIDSTKKSIDEERFIQFFCRRKPKSTWSRINKEKVVESIKNGRMTKAGLKCIEVAKENGSWTILDSVEALEIPEDLDGIFGTYPGSKDFFLSLSKSTKKGILYWIVSAKRVETRQKRIEEVAKLAAKKMKPKQF